jgi:hypothetical protein
LQPQVPAELGDWTQPVSLYSHSKFLGRLGPYHSTASASLISGYCASGQRIARNPASSVPGASGGNMNREQ